MTRDEAEKRLCELHVPRDLSGRYHIIDILETLGLLKLDEPKSARSKALTALFVHFGASDIETVFGLLDNADLKIVEK